MLFINTRPQDRAEDLSHALRMAHIEVLDLPLLELTAQPWSQSLAQLYEQLPAAQVIVVVSPTAVSIGMDYLKKASIGLNQLQQLQWIAVGEKTAQALAQYDITAVVPRIETSEGMLQLPILHSLQAGTCIAFWRGEGGRAFMMEQLKQQGVNVLNMVLYKRHCPAATQQNFPQILAILKQQKQYLMVISSEASWINWLHLMLGQSHLISHGYYWVLGERLYQLLLEYRKKHHLCFNIARLTDLKTDSILQKIAVVQGNT